LQFHASETDMNFFHYVLRLNFQGNTELNFFMNVDEYNFY